ncbi:hypothetical protein PG993_013938 [Apiospora rasikravindrae]|uniref:Uncharacterized protein n=1 Tax=Apiospora rasikravindrae TaxID=990691 RepID=A0ABR1RRU4_9PEZI
MGLKVNIASHKDFKSLVLRDALVGRIKRLNRLLGIQQNEIQARYREVAARYQEVLELRWVCLKAQCMEQARQLYGTKLSHVMYDTIICGIDGIKDGVEVREKETTFVVSVHCVGRRASSSNNSSSSKTNDTSERTTLSLPSREQQDYELEQLDGCLAAALQRPKWMPRQLMLEVFDWQSGGGGDYHSHGSATPRTMPPPLVSRRRAAFCLGSFDACAIMQKEAEERPAEVAKVSADAALVVCDDDSSPESDRDASDPVISAGH